MILNQFIKESLEKEIHALEYLIKRLNKEDILIKNLCHSIIEKFEYLGFGLINEQPAEYVQLLHDFNMIHLDYDLKYVRNQQLNYWQNPDRYNK